MKCITVGLDVGNESVKLVDYLGHVITPNVICRSSILNLYDDRVDPEDYTNFTIVSGAVTGDFFFCNLAARQDAGRTLFMPAAANKAEAVQYYVAALGALALRALQVHLDPQESEIAVRVVLSLPMRDWFKSRAVVEQKLVGEHLIALGSMPGVGGRTVALHIVSVLVSIEGMAALINNVYDHRGGVKSLALRDSTVRVVDIGKETTDLPKIKRMIPQPEPESTWEDWGAGRYLDAIIRKARERLGVVIPNPAQLAIALTHDNGFWRVRGRQVDLKQIAIEEFSAMAERAARTVEAHFGDDVDVCIMVGGATDAMRPYLGSFLDLREYPVVMGQEGECLLENARGNYLMGLGRKWAPVERDAKGA